MKRHPEDTKKQKAGTQLESLLLKIATDIDNRYIQCVNMVIQGFETKRRKKLVASVFRRGSNSVGRVPAFQVYG